MSKRILYIDPRTLLVTPFNPRIKEDEAKAKSKKS